jgi:ferric-dicitrate binding protein FerR (iron transport regulator)
MELIEKEHHKESIHQLLEATRQRLANTVRLSEVQSEKIFSTIFNESEKRKRPNIPSGGKMKRLAVRISIAASILFCMGLTGYLLFNNKASKPRNMPASTQVADISAPANNRATITLSNGERIYLDSVANGTLTSIGNVQLVKLAEGKIAYHGAASEILYNTLTNPNASKVIDMELADGSHVWLNAGSSLTFPVAFVGNERKVSITGEAYFEVAPSIVRRTGAKQPFIVQTRTDMIEVVGTHFNILAYDNEAQVRTTLLEGAVKIGSRMLKPGQEHAGGQIKEADPEQAIAWKNGLFSFKGNSLEDVMRQLARWYDITVKYEGEMPNKRFGGKIHRDARLSEVLTILEESNVRYRINNKEIVITR